VQEVSVEGSVEGRNENAKGREEVRNVRRNARKWEENNCARKDERMEWHAEGSKAERKEKKGGSREVQN